MEVINRSECVVCGSSDLKDLTVLPNFPVYMGGAREPFNQDICYDMKFKICQNCGEVQLADLLPLDIVYNQSHGSGVVGTAWRKHHEAFADFVLEYASGAILEIGGGHGILSSICVGHGFSDWTSIEPNPGNNYPNHVTVVNGYFGKSELLKSKYQTIVHSHVFEHVYTPQEFLEDLDSALDFGGKIIFSVPNMNSMLQNNYVNMLNFEHTYWLSADHLMYLLSRNNYSVVDKQMYLDDHSVFYVVEKKEDEEVDDKDFFSCGYADKIENDFIAYFSEFKEKVIKVNKSIESHAGEVYCFGGHIFTQYLFAYGLKSDLIAAVLDNDLEKHESRLYGCELMIALPDRIEDDEFPLVITSHMGAYTSEIEAQLIELNPSTVFC